MRTYCSAFARVVPAPQARLLDGGRFTAMMEFARSRVIREALRRQKLSLQSYLLLHSSDGGAAVARVRAQLHIIEELEGEESPRTVVVTPA